MARHLTRRHDQYGARGFTYLWVLVAIAVLGIGLLAVSEVWVTTARRQRLAEIDWIGAQFTQAIGSYYYATPALAKSYPPSLQDLVQDRRFVTTRRHIREVYRNPFTGAADWELVTSSNGGIRGVRAIVPTEAGGVVKEFVFQP